MFLKLLKIESGDALIRAISFYKGINLIVDETTSKNRQESGNNVGKTTVLRLIDFCLGGEGKNIYRDTEFKAKSNSAIKDYLTQNNVSVSLELVSDLECKDAQSIVIKKIS